ncbi:transformer-2 protein homolog alpha isoform X3 [Magallana gigas]|uniref:transformer-2 protein homolog alpha isoform X3 n=1 Tax=Magallana gigas TaxID=29159 RepID=UPI0033406188
MSENGELRMSRSHSRESEGSHKSDATYSHSRSPSNEKGSPKSRDSRSKSRSKSPYRRSSRRYSGSRSRSRSHSRGHKRSRSRSYHRDRYSRSRSRSYHRRSRYSRSRSRGKSPNYRDYYSRESRSSRHRSRSRSPGYSRRRRGKETSPMSNRRRHTGNRDNPEPTKCLGIFGLSLYTQERDLREVFGRFGPLEDVQVVYDRQTGRSRGFAFIHFRNVEDSIEVHATAHAKDRGPGMEIDGRRIRVDFSITTRAHTPTPGIYLGKPTASSYSRRRSPSPYHRGGGGGGGYSRGSRYSRSRSRSRSYSPRGGYY